MSNIETDSQIPQRFSGEWETKQLGDVASFFKGSGLSKTDLSPDGKRRCIHYGELFTTYKECISEVLHGTNRDGTFFLSLTNDVLMPGSDVTPNGLATASCISMPNVILGGDILVIRVPADILNGTFLAYAIKINHNQIMQLVSGTTVYHLYGRDMANFTFIAPSVPEQKAIVNVLSDMDAEIAALEALIAKKRSIKQATMQQLLTGKTRLPGFSGEWETKLLGEITNIQKGSLITEKSVVPGPIPVIAGGQKPAYYHNIANRTGKTITVSGSGAYAGFVALHNQPIFASDCSTISENSNFSIDFIYYFLVFNQDVIYKAQTGGAQPHIHPVDLMPLEVNLPELSEQEAIASVLSDMDAEIAALEQRRDKTRAIKQGMMQQLLTGRVRLSESRICTDNTDDAD